MIICLDTNYLICSLISGSQEAEAMMRWYQSGKKMITSAVAWYEFLCGPVSKEQIQTVTLFLTGGIVPFNDMHARESARLFNDVGRTRRLRVDAMIAATCIVEKTPLATGNHLDFQAFVPLGLKLVKPPS
ncbi:MAG: type II toxin-antitoxin system VapC family toxin [Chthoniobacterales bacterium]|nr:type II toxin-antitoxin system VapC family toxin [Chthoniobacterales bacterium]